MSGSHLVLGVTFLCWMSHSSIMSLWGEANSLPGNNGVFVELDTLNYLG